MKSLVIIAFVASFFGGSTGSWAAPLGFEKPGLIAELKSGKVTTETPVSTATEWIQIGRSYFRNVGTPDYITLATNHKKFALILKDGSPRIANAETLETNLEKTEFSYRLLVEVDAGFGLVIDVTPELKQVVVASNDTDSEASVQSQLINYRDQITHASYVTRVIPFEGGLLVEDRAQIVLRQQSQWSSVIKKQLGILFTKFSGAFRSELGGHQRSIASAR